MGQKVHPESFRRKHRKKWRSAWCSRKKDIAGNIKEDDEIRRLINKQLQHAGIDNIKIERAGSGATGKIRVGINTSRPGIVIGRKGQDLETLKAKIQKITKKDTIIDIIEISKPDLMPKLVAEGIAMQLVRKVPFRRALKKAIQAVMAQKEVDGIKIIIKGRLGGAEIARKEEQKAGSVPLHTIRADVQYGFYEAHTPYGIIGVRVYICLKPNEN